MEMSKNFALDSCPFNEKDLFKACSFPRGTHLCRNLFCNRQMTFFLFISTKGIKEYSHIVKFSLEGNFHFVSV